ncbi:MAG: ROK family protein [bacterium]|nr:ROK family protein [bacterium]MDE0286998.1 ROK family protein [bacterium]MDE0437365.1 ROK family protein [bacterium]
MAVRLGIDIGGSGIKGAPVDLESGALTAERVRIMTPRPSHPEAVAGVVRRVVDAFPDVTGAIGCTFPAIVLDGRINSAANVDRSWIGTDADRLFSQACQRPVSVVNDADAAGVAEARVGAAAGRTGVVIVLTLGTGIGSALLHDGHLMPNTELGHLELQGRVVEKGASNRARKTEKLSFDVWTGRLNAYLAHLERIFSPDLFVIGGGISKRFGKFGPMLRARAEIVPAALRNDAGIVGAAIWAGR